MTTTVSLFDYLDNILKKKSFELYSTHINNYDFDSSFSKFMIIRYLSMSTNVTIRNFILAKQVELEKMPNKLFYKVLLTAIPKQNNSFIKYIK